MSYFDDYVATGLCCQTCGEFIDRKEPGFPRECDFCNNKVFEKIDKVARNEQRSNYAIKQFKNNDIKFILKNSKIGHFHVFRKCDNQLFQFWSGTGKITGPIPKYIQGDKRGIATLIKILIGKEDN